MVIAGSRIPPWLPSGWGCRGEEILIGGLGFGVGKLAVTEPTRCDLTPELKLTEAYGKISEASASMLRAPRDYRVF
jgi:hypothetical protein